MLQLATARQWRSSPDTDHLSAVSQLKSQKGLQSLFLDAFPSHPALLEGSLLLLPSQKFQTQDLTGNGVKCHPLSLVFLQS